ncbi:hypothetical protein [Brevibacillus sp. SYSU BS000544]|uniref:hypothetical protein n=1 Tax=Brevibacillus sp. SYSU BS000544 TaxID=3416443 RepID=UPI003CE521C0
MATISIKNNDLIVEATIDDIQTIIAEAVQNLDQYKQEIAVIYEKMPKFDYKHFCFYAYETYRLLENSLKFSCDAVGHFRLIAPESFFYAFYGVIATLHEQIEKNKI